MPVDIPAPVPLAAHAAVDIDVDIDADCIAIPAPPFVSGLPSAVLADLNASEIPYSLRSRGVDGWSVKLRSHLGGVLVKTKGLKTIGEVAEWLYWAAAEHYAASDFVRRHRSA